MINVLLWCGLLCTCASATLFDINVNWGNVKTNTSTAATVEVDAMSFLSRTPRGAPIGAYKEALSQLGAQYVRYAPWYPNPRVVVPELTRSDCTKSTPATNWNSTYFDGIVRDFMAVACGPDAVSGACKLSVVQQLSTMPSWMYQGGMAPDEIPSDPWNTTFPLSKYTAGGELVDKSCGEMARHVARIVGWYTAGGFDDECGHWHDSGLHYAWWGLSVLNEDEHQVQPANETYVQCYDAIKDEVAKVNPKIVVVGPELGVPFSEYFLDPSKHAESAAPPFASYRWRAHARNATAESFFPSWDHMVRGEVQEYEAFKNRFGKRTEFALNGFNPFIEDWCNCSGQADLCGGQRFSHCPNWHTIQTAGGGPNSERLWGVGINRGTWSWNAAAAVIAYGYGTLAELGYKYVGQDQSMGGPWPGNEPATSCLDWQTGQPNAKHWVTKMLATTVGTSEEKDIVSADIRISDEKPPFSQNAADTLYVLPYIKAGTKGILIVNKKASAMTVRFNNATPGACAEVLEVEGPEPGFTPPVRRPLGADGTLTLRPFGVAVLADIGKHCRRV